MQHSAKFTIIVDPDLKPVHFYIRGGGQLETVRTLLRLGMRNRRRQVKLQPQDFAANIMLRIGTSVDSFHLFPDGRYAWHYRINLTEYTPTITVRYPAGDTNSFMLFKFVGPELKHRPKEALKPRTAGGQGRRGRPSNLQTDPRITPAMRARMREELERKLQGEK